MLRLTNIDKVYCRVETCSWMHKRPLYISMMIVGSTIAVYQGLSEGPVSVLTMRATASYGRRNKEVYIASDKFDVCGPVPVLMIDIHYNENACKSTTCFVE